MYHVTWCVLQWGHAQTTTSTQMSCSTGWLLWHSCRLLKACNFHPHYMFSAHLLAVSGGSSGSHMSWTHSVVTCWCLHCSLVILWNVLPHWLHVPLSALLSLCSKGGTNFHDTHKIRVTSHLVTPCNIFVMYCKWTATAHLYMYVHMCVYSKIYRIYKCNKGMHNPLTCTHE